MTKPHSPQGPKIWRRRGHARCPRPQRQHVDARNGDAASDPGLEVDTRRAPGDERPGRGTGPTLGFHLAPAGHEQATARRLGRPQSDHGREAPAREPRSRFQLPGVVNSLPVLLAEDNQHRGVQDRQDLAEWAHATAAANENYPTLASRAPSKAVEGESAWHAADKDDPPTLPTCGCRLLGLGPLGLLPRATGPTRPASALPAGLPAKGQFQPSGRRSQPRVELPACPSYGPSCSVAMGSASWLGGGCKGCSGGAQGHQATVKPTEGAGAARSGRLGGTSLSCRPRCCIHVLPCCNPRRTGALR